MSNKHNKNLDRAKLFRKQINKTVEGIISTDNEIIDNPEIYSFWAKNNYYKKDRAIRYGDKVYRILQDHKSHPNKQPDKADDMYMVIAGAVVNPSVYDTWITGQKYSKGDIVAWLDKNWISDKNNNYDEPSTSKKWLEN